MKHPAPEPALVRATADRYLSSVRRVERVHQGASTYVYRADTAQGIYYLRYLPEPASYAAEALAHSLLLDHGVQVPKVIAFEHYNEAAGLSLMITEAMPGSSMKDAWPGQSLSIILHEAGRQLALLHQLPVDGFGWIDRTRWDKLYGEKASFTSYFDEYLSSDLEALHQYGFTPAQHLRIAECLMQARSLLHPSQAVLVHGDFDITHIFHQGGQFSGFIDLGEIRGCTPHFDLGTFWMWDPSPDGRAYRYLLEGYRQIAPLTDSEACAAQLMALFQLVRFLGKKAGTPAASFWYAQAQKVLKRLSQA